MKKKFRNPLTSFEKGGTKPADYSLFPLFQRGLGVFCILFTMNLLISSMQVIPQTPFKGGQNQVSPILNGAWEMTSSGEVKYDSSNIEVRSDTAYFKILSDDRAFEYKEAPPNPSILSIILNKIGEFLERIINEKNWNIYQLIFIILFIGLVVYIIFRLIKVKGSGLLFQTPNINGSVFLDENNQEINYMKLIDDAVQSERYSDAVRYYYLNVLRELSSKKIIKWAISKTNFDYFDEIKDNELRYSFRKISYIFDYIEYGEFSIDLQVFNKVKKSFEDFNKKIGLQQ